MGSSNLLSGNVEVLEEIKEHLLELQGYKSKYSTLSLDEDRFEKSIKSMEKSISEEIEDTTKTRRQEIEATFDKQINKTGSHLRKTKDKRDKRKNTKVSERIKLETATLHEENNKLRLETKAIIKQKRVPSLCNTRLFYAMYYPGNLGDFLIILFTLLLTLFAIPCGIYFFVLPEEKISYLIIIYIISVIVFGGLYLLIGERTKEKHREALIQMRGLRKQARVNRKEMGIIRKNILKDSDESGYGLEKYDEELVRLEQDMTKITEQKKEALLLFENSTRQVITAEIKGRFEDKLNALKKDYERISGETGKTDQKIKALTIKIASEFEPFLGKDLMTLERLDSLINIIMAGNASTISEAITFYKQSMTKPVQ